MDEPQRHRDTEEDGRGEEKKSVYMLIEKRLLDPERSSVIPSPMAFFSSEEKARDWCDEFLPWLQRDLNVGDVMVLELPIAIETCECRGKEPTLIPPPPAPPKPPPPEKMLSPNEYCYENSNHFIVYGSEEDMRERAKGRLRLLIDECLRTFGLKA